MSEEQESTLDQAYEAAAERLDETPEINEPEPAETAAPEPQPESSAPDATPEPSSDGESEPGGEPEPEAPAPEGSQSEEAYLEFEGYKFNREESAELARYGLQALQHYRQQQLEAQQSPSQSPLPPSQLLMRTLWLRNFESFVNGRSKSRAENSSET